MVVVVEEKGEEEEQQKKRRKTTTHPALKSTLPRGSLPVPPAPQRAARAASRISVGPVCMEQPWATGLTVAFKYRPHPEAHAFLHPTGTCTQ